jgi:polyisoprenyl-teichoic acid--peptidoglycan teichoic acid transferase
MTRSGEVRYRQGMSRVQETWAGMGRGSRVAAVAGIFALTAALAAVLGGAYLLTRQDQTAVEPSFDPSVIPSDIPLPPTPSRAPDVSPPPSPSPSPRGADPLLGTDGRLTVLLLGSDYRPSHPGNRTDAIMVVSVDPTTGQSAGFSVPRDTVNFPLPASGNYKPKVNALLAHLENTTSDGYESMKKAVARAFDLEIDRYVFIGFAGVKQLVGAVGGVDVTLAKAYYDPYYWVNSRKQGWGLPAGTSHLGSNDALIFARSRKGDNDFGRARRQQMLVMAALQKVRSVGPSKVPQLLTIAARTVRTDLPLDRANDLFELFSTVEIAESRGVVFGPRTYATGTAAGSFALKLDVCRTWIAKNFPPARPLGAWPDDLAPAASPSPSG